MSIFNPRSWFKKSPSKEGNVNFSSTPSGKPPDEGHLNRRPEGGVNDGETLSDIVRGIAHAASAANSIQDRQFIQQINQYFHKEEDGTLVPKVVRAKIDDNTYMEVPLISMIDPSTIGLEEMEVRMGIRLSKSDVKKNIKEFNTQNEMSRSSFNVSLTSCKPGERQDIIDVVMKFKKTDAAEGASRLVDEMNGTVQPRKYDANTKKPVELTHIFTTSKNKDEDDTKNTKNIKNGSENIGIKEDTYSNDETDELRPHDHNPDESGANSLKDDQNSDDQNNKNDPNSPDSV